MSLEHLITKAWYQDKPWVRLLSPLTPVYRFGLERQKRRARKNKSQNRLPVPVVVVGNITVGGTGKTPLIQHLTEQLQTRGRRVGIVSRGYGARTNNYPFVVSATDSAKDVGDEPLMLVQHLGVPLVIDPDRLAAVKHLLATHPEVDVILSDDGMQHYRLPRDLEILVVDGARELGNERLLPAGPLREPLERLQEVDFCLINGRAPALRSAALRALEPGDFQLFPRRWRQLCSDETLDLNALPQVARMKAVAGIGNPERFYATLVSLGISAQAQPLNDHQILREEELLQLGAGDTETLILMTTKDAVKYRDLVRGNGWLNIWALEVDVQMDSQLQTRILNAIEEQIDK